jgi:hypothetical protein
VASPRFAPKGPANSTTGGTSIPVIQHTRGEDTSEPGRLLAQVDRGKPIDGLPNHIAADRGDLR